MDKNGLAQEQKRINDTIARVQQMEQYLDEIREAMRIGPEEIAEDAVMQGKLQELMQYYDGGQWLRDYEADEKGELPSDLKRGVLAEDTLYNLFCEIREQDCEE